VALALVFGRVVASHSWSRLVQHDDLLAGRLWTGVLIRVAIAPLLAYDLQR